MGVDSSFWHSRWAQGRIAFHEGKPNVHLVNHQARLGTGKRVFVPLCGKAEDLAWLASREQEVVGVELVEVAVSDFFDERSVKPTITRRGRFNQYSADNITLLAGDFFDLTPEILGPVDAFYGRSAVTALPSELRRPYAQRVCELMPAGAPGLIVTVEYPQHRMKGPPFSVPEAELRAIYERPMECLAEVPAEDPRLAPLGAVEKCFFIQF